MEDLKQKYKNYTTGKKLVAEFIQEKKLNVKWNDDFLERLFHHHPKTNKVKNIEYFVMRRASTFTGYVLCFKNREDDEEDDISYDLCLRSLFGLNKDEKIRHLEHMTKAFRSAVSSTKRITFFHSQVDKLCNICGASDRIDVDHFTIPFSEIFDAFFLETALDESEITLKRVNYTYRTCDYTVEDRWIAYHDRIATYRLLCKSCNSSVGDGGYRKRKRDTV